MNSNPKLGEPVKWKDDPDEIGYHTGIVMSWRPTMSGYYAVWETEKFAWVWVRKENIEAF